MLGIQGGIPCLESDAATISGCLSADPNGIADFASARILFNTSFASAHACYVIYYPSSNVSYLENDAGTEGTMVGMPGSSGQVSNSQCTLAAAGSSVTQSGTTRSMTLALSFNSTFLASQNVCLYATESNGTISGWTLKGTWTP